MIRNTIQRISRSFFTALIVLLGLSFGALAGSLTPSGAVSTTMNSLADLYASIAGTFNSSAIVGNQNGSLLGNLKYIEQQSAWASSSNDIWSLNSGNVGIGTNVPNAKLNIQVPDGDYGVTVNNTANGTASDKSVALYQGSNGDGHIDVNGLATFDFTSDSKFYAQHTNGYVNDPAGSDYAVGASANILNTAAAGNTIVAANGQTVYGDPAGTSTFITVGGQFETIVTQNAIGLIENAYGVSGFVNATALAGMSITNAFGGSFSVNASGSTAITNAYALQIGNQKNGAGTITNNYGLYINDQTGVGNTQNFNLYSAGTGKNYFGGKVGIGTTNINNKLEVAGTASISKILVDLLGAQTTSAVCHPNNGQTKAQELVDCDPTAADYMELYPTDFIVQQGEIVMPDETRQVTTTDGDHVAVLIPASERARMLGIVSVASRAGDFNSVGHNLKKTDNPQPLALNGRVKVMVNGENGAIIPGDPITLSSTPGVGAKALTAGFIVGTALEPFSGDSGQVMVYVRPTYWAPQIIASPVVSAGQSLIDTLINYLQDAILSVRRLVVHDEVCIGDTCVNQQQLRQILENMNSAVTTPLPSDTPAPSEAPSPSDAPTDTPSAP